MGPDRSNPPLVRATAALTGLLFLSSALGGCYTYVPPEPPEPVAGQEVRVELTGAGTDRIRDARALEFEALEGLYVEGDARELAVEVELDANRLGYGSSSFLDTLRVPRTDVRSVAVKEISTSRTVLSAAIGVAGVLGLYAAFGSGAGGEGGDEDGDQFIVLPLARLLGSIGAVFAR